MNKKKEKNGIKTVILTVAILVSMIFSIYGCYWIIKSVSYNVFYKDMVKATITEMVRPESLQ